MGVASSTKVSSLSENRKNRKNRKDTARGASKDGIQMQWPRKAQPERVFFVSFLRLDTGLVSMWRKKT